jgi:DNA-binding beta-propeller fold protein YncE
MRTVLMLFLAAVVLPEHAHAQIAVSANDAKVTLVDGVVTPVRSPSPDTVSIIDLSVSPPKVIVELQAPASVVGPPQSVAIAPDGSIALVTAATKIDPADPGRTISDNRITVIDLKASPPAVAGTLHAGSGASGVSFNPSGTLALVANRIEGTVSVFTVKGTALTPAGKVDLGAPESGPSHVAFSRDGRMALVTRNNDSLISVLAVDGANVTNTKREIAAGFKPYSIEVSPAADVAVVGNVGVGPTGGVDVISVIDLAATPPRTVDHVTAGPTVETVAISPDGAHVAATVMNGSNAPRSSPFFRDFGQVRVFKLTKTTLTPVADARVGQWCQGAAWSRDARTLLVQCMTQREILVFRFDGRSLTPSGAIKVNGGPAGIRTGR